MNMYLQWLIYYTVDEACKERRVLTVMCPVKPSFDTARATVLVQAEILGQPIEHLTITDVV